MTQMLDDFSPTLVQPLRKSIKNKVAERGYNLFIIGSFKNYATHTFPHTFYKKTKPSHTFGSSKGGDRKKSIVYNTIVGY